METKPPLWSQHYLLLLYLLLLFPWASSEEQRMIQPPAPFPPHLWQEESSMGPVDCAALDSAVARWATGRSALSEIRSTTWSRNLFHPDIRGTTIKSCKFDLFYYLLLVNIPIAKVRSFECIVNQKEVWKQPVAYMNNTHYIIFPYYMFYVISKNVYIVSLIHITPHCLDNNWTLGFDMKRWPFGARVVNPWNSTLSRTPTYMMHRLL